MSNSDKTYSLQYTGQEIDERLKYAGQNPDWNENDPSKPTHILNKPRVDDQYNPSSNNAQSGRAVAQAIGDVADDLENKMDKVVDAVSDNVATFDANGNLKDSGKQIPSLDGVVKTIQVGASNPISPDVSGKLQLTSVPYQTTAPVSANTDGSLKIVVLPASQEPEIKLNGYIYFIQEE